MRITRQMMLQNALRGLVGNLNSLHRAHEAVATGLRIRRASDAPSEATDLMQLDSQLRSMERYRRAIVSVNTRLATEEAVLESAQKLIRQARDLAAVATSEEDPGRAAALQEIGSIREQIISLGNTRVSGEYIFGGDRVGSPPFQTDGTYVGNTVVREVEIGDGMRVAVNHTGDRVLSGTISALGTLEAQMESGSPEAIQAALDELETAQDALRASQGELGSSMRQVAEFEEYLVRQTNNLAGHREDLRIADPAESAVKLQEAGASLERAYAAVSRILSTNILDFLR